MPGKDEHAAEKKELPDLPLPDAGLGTALTEGGASEADLLEKLDEALHAPDKQALRADLPVRRPATGRGAHKNRFDQERVELRRVRDRSRDRPGANVPPAGGGKSRGRG